MLVYANTPMINGVSKLIDYNEKIKEEINTICRPLFQDFPITHFFYGKFFNDGHYFFVSPDSRALERFINYVERNANTFLQNAFFREETSIYKVMWSLAQEDMVKNLKNFDSLTTYHGLAIMRKNSEDQSIEISAFASRTNDVNNCNFFYLNQFDILERFNFYFKKKAFKIIESPILKKVAFSLLYVQFIKKIEENSILMERTRSNFIQQTQLQRYIIKNLEGNQIKLSRRQIECLYHFIHGRTAKEIAKLLKISYRTVQTHLNILKGKLGAYTRFSGTGFFSSELYNFIQTNTKNTDFS